MASAGGRRSELVEEREVRASTARAHPLDLGAGPSSDAASRSAHPTHDASKLHARHANLGRLSMPSASRLLRALRQGGLPAATRARLLHLELVRRARPCRAYPLRIGPTSVFLSHDDFEIDWKSLAFVAVDEAYAGDYRGAVVLDIGAHKGYFAAYALLHGARAVVSYEPETANFELLERAAADHLAGGGEWRTRRVAVGSERGEAELHVMSASWGHALHPPEAFSEYELAVQRVTVEALADVLAETLELAGDAPLVVKVNIEGEECPMILGTPASAWDGIAEVYVETHPWAACGADEIARHLEPAGLTRRESAHPAVLRLRRAGAARSGPRTAPS
jgi:FkbM family methyltransferase